MCLVSTVMGELKQNYLPELLQENLVVYLNGYRVIFVYTKKNTKWFCFVCCK